MSLQFPQDQLSKREKQEIFKRSLDEQRRTKQEASALHNQLPSSAGNRGHHVPGLPDTTAVNIHIPGLDQHQVSYAPRFEGSPSPQQEKQPYMSALSEMNGRPLHIRQQQFQKESQYRNMLKDQIAENKKRKDAEKAILEEEKRRELEELRRLQGIPAPRRQQHKQFQESPDHPLPSPGRLTPTTHNPAANPQQLQRPGGGNAGSQNYDRAEAMTPAHAASGEYSSRNPAETNGLGGEGRWQGQRDAPAHTQGGLGGDGRRIYSERQQQQQQQQTSAAAYSNDFAANGPRGPACHPARAAASSRPFGGGDQGAGQAGRPVDRFGMGAESLGAEGAARKLAFERGARWGEGGAVGQAESAGDSVPRADFDELSNLCRDLLHEQKQLRQRLEEREERERLAAERSAQQEEARRHYRRQQPDRQQQRGVPRRGGGQALANQGIASSSGDVRRRAPPVRESALHHDHRPKPKPSVAFGSSRPRMPSPTVDKPRVAANPKPRASGGRHDRRARASKSEPIPATETNGDMRRRHSRNMGSTNRGASGGSGEKLYTNHEASDSGWPGRDATRGAKGDGKGAEAGRFAGTDRECAAGGEWTSHESPGLPSPEVLGGGRSSTIHSLLRNAVGAGRHSVASRDTGARANGNGGDELGGESTFLAAHPMDSGLVAPEGQGLGLLGRGATGYSQI